MKSMVSRNNLKDIKAKEIEKIKANPEYREMHVDRVIYGQPQGLQPAL